MCSNIALTRADIQTRQPAMDLGGAHAATVRQCSGLAATVNDRL
jgi:hypothetical protein